MAKPNRTIPSLSQQDIQRFWSKVDRNGPLPAGSPHLGKCWIWTGGKFRGGYGLFSAEKGKRLLKSQRVSYFLANQLDPVGYLVCHECDNPQCINPDHLFLGTNKTNIQDRDRKNRTSKGASHAAKTYRATGDLNWLRRHPELVPRGEKSPLHKLTDSLVKEIRRQYDSNEKTIRNLAMIHGVTYRTIYLVVKRRSWTHV